jgi:hypothetical protein
LRPLVGRLEANVTVSADDGSGRQSRSIFNDCPRPRINKKRRCGGAIDGSAVERHIRIGDDLSRLSMGSTLAIRHFSVAHIDNRQFAIRDDQITVAVEGARASGEVLDHDQAIDPDPVTVGPVGHTGGEADQSGFGAVDG